MIFPDWKLVSHIRDQSTISVVLVFFHWRRDVRRLHPGWTVSILKQDVDGIYLFVSRHKNMNGRLGLASWRWVFIFDFIIGIPIAIFGFFCCPGMYIRMLLPWLCSMLILGLLLDEPQRERPWWMTETEQSMCIKRISDEGRDTGKMEWSLATIKRILTSWQFYCFCIAWG